MQFAVALRAQRKTQLSELQKYQITSTIERAILSGAVWEQCI